MMVVCTFPHRRIAITDPQQLRALVRPRLSGIVEQARTSPRLIVNLNYHVRGYNKFLYK